MSIKQKVASGLKWSAFSKGVSQLVSWVVTIYVIRLLAPSDYGLMAMVSVVIAFLSTFNEFGLGTALVQSDELDDEGIGAVFGAMLLMGAALSALLTLASPWIAHFFSEPALQALISIAGLQFLLNAATVVPESMLKRSMTFKPLSFADITGVITGSLTTLALALNDFAVWSLVLGNLTGAVARASLLIALNPRRVRPHVRLRSASTFLSFGGYVTAARFVGYFMSQADILIGAKLLGKEALGLYTVSMQLASLPMDKAMSTVNQVAFSAISRMQNHKHEMAQGLSKGIRWLAYLVFPAIYGLASVAPDFVPLVLGSNWMGAVLPLQLVALVIPLRMVAALMATANSGMGRADVGFRNTLTGVFVLPACFVVGVQWGEVGLAAAWSVGVPIVFIMNFKRTSQVTGLTAGQLFGSIAHPLFSAVFMVLTLALVRHALPETQPAWSTLALLIFTGATAYVSIATAADPQLRREIRALKK